MIKNKFIKIPKGYFVAVFLFFSLLFAISINLDPLLKKVEIFDISAWYNSLVAIFPTLTSILKRHQGICLTLFVLSGLLMLVRLIYKPRLILIRHQTFSPDIASIDKNYSDRYRIKQMVLDQCDNMTSNFDVVSAVKKQDDFIQKIQSKRKQMQIGYYGIAHTPLIFRFGFMFGDNSKIKLFHKKRANDAVFEEWNECNNTMVLNIKKELHKNIESDELLVAVATSLEITEQQLKVLHPENKHVVMFESNSLSFDSILSYNQAEYFRNTILTKVRDCIVKYGIRKMHLVLSTSVAFTFFLGQAISAQHDPETIIYHYQNGSYPWGIYISRTPEESLIMVNQTPVINEVNGN